MCFRTLVYTSEGILSGNAFPLLREVPRVRLRLSVVKCHLRNALCVVPHLPTKKLSCLPPKHLEASLLSQAQLEPGGACVLDRVLGPRCTYVGRSARLLGPKGKS